MKKALLLLVLSLFILPVFAQFEDDDEGGYGSVITPDMQWQIAEATWGARNYDDAAVLMVNLATEHPDHSMALDCWWRAYETYKYHRPNEEKYKNALAKGIEACTNWENKYKTEDINRASRAVWYRGNFLDREGNKQAAIDILVTAHQKYPGSNMEHEAIWHAAEWSRHLQNYTKAIDIFKMHTKVHENNNDWRALDYIRIGLCYTELKNFEAAKEAYLTPLYYEPLNWGWGEIHWGILDGARRLKAAGEVQAAREMLFRLIDKGHPDWDVVRQAQNEVGEESMFLDIYPHIDRFYISDSISVDARSNVDLQYNYSLLIRPKYLPEGKLFKAKITMEIKHPLTGVPNDMKAEGNAYTTTLAGHAGDYWYRVSAEEDKKVNLPDSVVINRSWEKAGEDWGYAVIRVQSRARYNIYIYMPNNKVNVNNLSIQPNEVRDGGTCFRWYDWYDLNNGMTIRIPIEVGKGVSKYYPKVELQRNIHGHIFPNMPGKGTKAEDDNKDIKITVENKEEFPYLFSYPGTQYVQLKEIKE